MKKIPYNLLVKEINQYDKIILAVSGGVDSMFLLDFFIKKFKGKIIVGHFNHKVRNESDYEEQYIKNYCLDHNVDFNIGYGHDLKNCKNFEKIASLQRWEFLEKIAKNNHANVIATAHHLNDKIENFFIQIMRGVPVNSLIMKKENKINGFIRYKPFIGIEKETLIHHSQLNKIKWFEDLSNLNNHYDRNFVRNEIIPLMMKRRNIMKTIPKTLKTIDDLNN